jgi:hypothetical protein
MIAAPSRSQTEPGAGWAVSGLGMTSTKGVWAEADGLARTQTTPASPANRRALEQAPFTRDV